MIIYTAILAHKDDGDAVSNVVKFMPFGGTLTFPDSDDVFIQVDDPGGIGTISVTGTQNADGTDVSISEISGNDGTAAYALYITDNKPYAFSSGGSTAYFIYHVDGSVGLHTVDENLLLQRASLNRSADDVSDIYIDCSKYVSRYEFEKELPYLKEFVDILKVREAVIYHDYDPQAPARLILYAIGIIGLDGSRNDPRISLLEEDIKFIFEIIKLTNIAVSIDLKYDFLREYDQQCSDEPVTYEYGDCHIPAGAEYNSYIADNELTDITLRMGTM